MKITKKLFTAVICTFFIGATANAQNDDFDRWDENGDDLIERNEFNTAFEDNDYYSDVDANNDNRLDEDELNNSIGEYNDNQHNDGLFNDWDRDRNGYVDNYEFYNGNFDLMDGDQDGSINNDEYADWNSNVNTGTNRRGNDRKR